MGDVLLLRSAKFACVYIHTYKYNTTSLIEHSARPLVYLFLHLVFIMTPGRDSWKIKLIAKSSRKRFLTLSANLALTRAAVPDCHLGFLSGVLRALRRGPLCSSGQKEPLNLPMLRTLWDPSRSTNTRSEPVMPGAPWRVHGHQHGLWKPHPKICQHLGRRPLARIQSCWTGQGRSHQMALSPCTTWSTKSHQTTRPITSLLCVLSQ